MVRPLPGVSIELISPNFSASSANSSIGSSSFPFPLTEALTDFPLLIPPFLLDPAALTALRVPLVDFFPVTPGGGGGIRLLSIVVVGEVEGDALPEAEGGLGLNLRVA